VSFGSKREIIVQKGQKMSLWFTPSLSLELFGDCSHPPNSVTYYFNGLYLGRAGLVLGSSQI